jgi:hypothetical protein
MKAGASADYTLFTTQGVNQFAIYDNAAGSERLTLSSSGNLGIGTTSPATKLDVAATEATIRVTSTTGTNLTDVRVVNTGGTLYSGIERSAGGALGPTGAYEAFLLYGADRPMYIGTGNSYLRFGTNATERMRIDSSGNLGLGVTPDALSFPFTSSSLQFAGGNSIYPWSGAGMYFQSNAYYNSSWKYKTTNPAGQMVLSIDGSFVWNRAASGTAGNTITFTQAMTLDASGNLGLGTTSLNLSGGASGSQIMTISASSSGRNGILELNGTRTTSGDYVGYVRFFNNGAATPLADIQAIRGSSDTTGVLAFATGNTERARIDSSGNFGVGTTNINYKAVIYNATTDTDVLTLSNNQINSDAQQHYVGLNLQDNNGSISGAGNASAIRSYSNLYATWGSSLTFWTTGGAGNGMFERARIDSSGNLLMGATSSFTTYASIQVTGDNKGVGIRDTTDGSYRAIYNQSGTLYFWNGSNEGYLSTAGAWVNASDARLKTNVRDVEYGLSAVMQSKPRSFERVDIDGSYVGFVAQELQELIPEVVSGRPEKQLGVDYGSLVAVAFKAIQEQQALIETLTQRITALEGR